MNFKENLEALRLQKLRERFADKDDEWILKFWYGAVIQYKKGRTAAQIEKNIISYIKALGHHAEKHSVVGREVTGKDVHTPMGTIKGKKTFIPSQSQKGSADLTSTIYGVSLKIEVKKGKDRMSEHQKKYRDQILAAGGFYFIAHDEDDFLIKFEEFLNEPKIQAMKQFS